MGGCGVFGGCIGVRMFLVMRVSGFVLLSTVRVLLVWVLLFGFNTSRVLWL